MLNLVCPACGVKIEGLSEMDLDRRFRGHLTDHEPVIREQLVSWHYDKIPFQKPIPEKRLIISNGIYSRRRRFLISPFNLSKDEIDKANNINGLFANHYDCRESAVSAAKTIRSETGWKILERSNC